MSILIYYFLGKIFFIGYLLFSFLFIFFENKLKYFFYGTLLITISLILFERPTLKLIPYNDYDITGEIVDIKIDSENYQKAILKLDGGYKFNISLHNEEKVQLYDKISGKFVPIERESLENFGFFDKNKYFFQKDIDDEGNFKIKNILKPTSYSKIIKKDFRNYVYNITNNFLSNKNSGIIQKLILARSDKLDQDITDLYRDGGLSHILAISGLHIMIIIYVLDFILLKMNIPYNLRTGSIIAIVFIYGFLIDFPPSMSRALLMFSIQRLSEIGKFFISNLGSIFLSGIILLFIKPKFLFDLGFQLSYMSVLGIYFIYNRLPEKYKNSILSPVFLYLSVNIFIFPILIYNFNNFNLVSILTNLIITPIFTTVLVLSYIGLIFGKLIKVSTIIFSVINLLLDFINNLIEIIVVNFKIPIKLFIPDYKFVVIYYLFLLFYIFSINLKVNKNTRVTIIISTISIYLMFNLPLLGNDLYLGFLDVGQGDSIYLSYKNKYIQIDTGGSRSFFYNPGEEITVKAIEKRGIKKVDYLIISHFDYDHIGGVYKLIENNLVDSIIINRPEKENFLFEKIKRTNSINLFYPKGDLPLVIDENLKIYFFNTENNLNLDSNDSSLITLIEFKDKKILLTGDATSDIENRLGEIIGKVDILKVAHHGSKYSSSRSFLENIRPDYSIISVGRNTYGHPHEDVLENLNSINSKVLRTDISGEIVFKIGDDISYKTYVDSKNENQPLITYIFSGIIIVISIFIIKKEGECYEIRRF